MKKNGHSPTETIRTSLKSVHISNYRSLRDVTLRFKPLTIIVGPNASGKSNCLEALRLMNRMMVANDPPPRAFVKDNLWVNGGKNISLGFNFESGTSLASYNLEIGAQKNPFQREELTVDGHKVISVSKGKGYVQNEDGNQQLPFTGMQLAIKSAGSYGEKPVTNQISDFMKSWEFYDVDPNYIRNERIPVFYSDTVLRLDPRGGLLRHQLTEWASEDTSLLDEVNEGLRACGGAKLEIQKRTGVRINEGLSRTLPFDTASDGTLRLLFYYTLPHQPDLPALIGIEEPERNLHPGLLTKIAYLLELLSQKAQVVITTHSSQLLDCFSVDSLDNDVAIILLHKKEQLGTQALSLEDIQNDRDSLRSWMNDFGIGNAIFQSQLLQDITER